MGYVRSAAMKIRRRLRSTFGRDIHCEHLSGELERPLANKNKLSARREGGVATEVLGAPRAKHLPVVLFCAIAEIIVGIHRILVHGEFGGPYRKAVAIGACF